tara:strand:+ start:496 stop:750 length:255 start_codon:yes stop_codon:yes gene_type:complete
MMAKTEMGYSVVIESEEREIDDYYLMLKKNGWFDYVDDFVLPEWNIDGVRIDTEMNYSRTIYTPHIRCEDTPRLLGQLKMMRGI